ncbi:hypothetical protein BDZ97DRAFT_489633 [Flammula alnicola]|nr:hypothetical protein BDZ97DRAFT_489633 [Flammula alnicola]
MTRWIFFASSLHILSTSFPRPGILTVIPLFLVFPASTFLAASQSESESLFPLAISLAIQLLSPLSSSPSSTSSVPLLPHPSSFGLGRGYCLIVLEKSRWQVSSH